MISEGGQEKHIHYSMVASVTLSFAFFLVPSISYQLIYLALDKTNDSTDGDEDTELVCLSSYVIVAGICVVTGLIFSHSQMKEDVPEINIWAQIEGLDEEANRESGHHHHHQHYHHNMNVNMDMVSGGRNNGAINGGGNANRFHYQTYNR